ncbi:hypothetical protein ACROYT_G035001 [Oculina patagonica]
MPTDRYTSSGAGYFTSKFTISEESIKYISPLAIESIRSIPVKAGNTFTIAEYGCADGGTSMPLMYACVKELRKLYGNNLEIHINYEDKPESDFNSLFYFLQARIVRLILQKERKFVAALVQTPTINIVFDNEDQDQEAPKLIMEEKIVCQLESICVKLAGVEERLQNMERIFERFAALENSVNSIQIELNTLNDKSKSVKDKAVEIEKAMEFANTEIEELKKKDKENEDKIKELEDKLLYQEVYNRRENLRFFGIPEAASGAEDTAKVVHHFFKEELELEDGENIEFQRAHRIGKKKTGEARPVIVRFLRFPDRELVFRRVREMEDEINVKVYSDYPKEISERRKKQWPKLKKAREEGKIAFFLKPEPDKLFIDGQFVPM